jgi:acyl-CoA reductase-like NAD-dependent aldehyde dehydrogenase
LANQNRFGLATSIWTNNIKLAHRVASNIDAGIIWINDHHKNDPSSPWGGFKDSGNYFNNFLFSIVDTFILIFININD